MEVVRGDGADRVFVVCGGPIGENESVKGIRGDRGGEGLEYATPAPLVLELLNSGN